MQAIDLQPMSHDDYLQGELESDCRHEFYNGYVYAMAGAGVKHNIISGNLFSALRHKARGTDCRTFIADMKLYIADLNRFYYPDLLLACDPEDDHEYYKQNPCLVVEVLSPSTENIDRREKLHTYQSIASLQEYLLVAQDKMDVELYRRHGKHWQYFRLNSESDILQINCLNLEMTMPEIYEDIVF